MLRLHGSTLENVISFKQAKVRYDKHQLTFVRGVNKDSDLSNPTSNGVGKSLLFSCAPNILYQSPPASPRKNSKKDLLGKKTANTLSFTTTEGVKYSITQTAKGYNIVENGVPLEISRIPDAEKFIKRVMPITELDYYTYCFVSTQRPYAMQVATDVSRLDCLTQLFRLDSYDLMRQHFNTKLHTIKTNEITLSVFEKNLLETRAKVNKSKDTLYKHTSKEVLQGQIDDLEIELQAVVKKYHVLEQRASVLSSLYKIDQSLEKLRKNYPFKTKPSVQLPILLKDRKLLIAYDRYLSEKKGWESQHKKLQAKLTEAKKDLPLQSKKDLENLVGEYGTDLGRIAIQIDTMRDERKVMISSLRELEACYEAFKEYSVSIKDIKAFSTDELAQVKILVKLHNVLCTSDVEGDSCPICTNPVKFKDIERTTKKAVKRLPILLNLGKAKKAYDRWVELKKSLPADLEGNLAFLDSEVERAKKDYDKLNGKLLKVEASLDSVERYEKLKDSLVQLDKEHKPEAVAKPKTEYTLDEHDDLISVCNSVISKVESKDSILSSHPEIKSLDMVKNAEQLEDCRKKQKSLRNKLSLLSDDLSAVSYLNQELEHNKESLTSIKTEIAKLKPAVQDKQVYESLVKAYSTKGLKTKVAGEICTLIETNLNMYRHLVFAEPFSFSVKASTTGISILVDRGNGHSSDVRLLSGAESNSFVLLFLIAVLVLVPSERRLNILVLDEPCSHQDDVSRDIFLHKYLPALQELVPHVFVITPHLTDYVEGSALWTVTKENGISTITVN